MKSIMCSTFAVCLVSLFMAAGVAAEDSFVDPLEAPAEASPLAQHSQLLAIARAGSRLVVAGMRGHILYSDDEGRTWSQASVPLSVTLTALSFPTPQQGWAVGHSGVVLHTADGGQNWERQLDGRRTPADMIGFYEGLAAGGDEVAARLVQELPVNWQDGPEQPWLGVWFADGQHGFVTGAFNLMLETRDGGNSWTPWTHRLDNPEALHLNAIERIGTAFYIPSERGVVFRMRDGEERFSALQTGYAGSFFGICGDERVLLAYGLRGTLYASQDQGETWSALPPAIPVALTACTRAADGRFLLAAASGHVVAVAPGANGPVATPRDGAPWPLAGIALAADGKPLGVGMRGIWRAEQ
ncbi:MAG TPA: YCF48-related protein [Pseudomonadales bacterium]|nr:YCF48-related protein [Pseudomonadales bacterium]